MQLLDVLIAQTYGTVMLPTSLKWVTQDIHLQSNTIQQFLGNLHAGLPSPKIGFAIRNAHQHPISAFLHLHVVGIHGIVGLLCLMLEVKEMVENLGRSAGAGCHRRAASQL